MKRQLILQLNNKTFTANISGLKIEYESKFNRPSGHEIHVNFEDLLILRKALDLLFTPDITDDELSDVAS